ALRTRLVVPTGSRCFKAGPPRPLPAELPLRVSQFPPKGIYGAKGDGDIVPPDSWLVIEVELIYVDRPTST
ncbi:hypothetical protein MTR67_045946, partial [Solanum verrucosum]